MYERMTFTAKIRQIFPLESFTTREGRPFCKRHVLLQTDAQYPDQMLITLTNDLASNFSKREGDSITAHIDFRVSPSADGSRYFNDIRAWRIE